MSKLFKNLTVYQKLSHSNQNKLKTNILLLLFVITINLFLQSCKSKTTMPNITCFAMRLLPGQDLIETIEKFAEQKKSRLGGSVLVQVVLPNIIFVLPTNLKVVLTLVIMK